MATDLDTLLNNFTAYLEKRDRSPHSIRAYLSDLRHFAAWFQQSAGEPFSPTNVNDADIRDWRDHFQDKFSPATLNRRLSALGTFFDWAISKGLAQEDPTLDVQGVEQTDTAPKALSEQTVNRILRKARENHRDHALLHLLAATGLRAAEVADLKVSDIQLGERSGWVTVRAGKGRKFRRVPIQIRAREPLARYIDNERKVAAPNDPLFLTVQGQAMTPYAIWYTVKKYAALAEIENVSPHSFRHTVATRLVRNPKVDIVTAATFLGHSRLDTTARYSRPSEKDLEDAAEKL